MLKFSWRWAQPCSELLCFSPDPVICFAQLQEDGGDLNFGDGAKGGKGKNKKSGRSKEVVTDLNFTTPPIVRDSPRTARGPPRTGGRGGPRGGGQGGGAGANIVLDDSSFPSLG